MARQATEATLGGIFLLLVGGAVWGIGGAIGNSQASAVGVIMFALGILLVLTGVAGFLDKLKI